MSWSFELDKDEPGPASVANAPKPRGIAVCRLLVGIPGESKRPDHFRAMLFINLSRPGNPLRQPKTP